MADFTEKLERLAGLLREGLLTRDEFEEQKAALLAQARRDSNPPPEGQLGTTPISDQGTAYGGSGLGKPAQPESVGAYAVTGFMGQGGMGAVYRGRHRNGTIATRQGGDVAIKVMHAHFARSPEFRARFEREAGLSLKLDHPGIVKAHDLVVDGGTLALVMELVEGRPLATQVGRDAGPIPWAAARPWIEQLLDAVDHAHTQRIIHRDLKPENVMLGAGGRLKILDFGIGKEAGGAGGTATGVGMGTVDYMAPEQHTDAKNVDGRADVYALGMILYEMLAGRLPWDDGLDAVGVLHRKLTGELPPLTGLAPATSDAVATAVHGALDASPSSRTPTVAALRSALFSVAAAPRHHPPAPPTVPEQGGEPKPPRGRREPQEQPPEKKKSLTGPLVASIGCVALLCGGGLLAALVVPNMLAGQLRAKRSEAPTNLNSIRTAEKAYAAEWDSFTTVSPCPPFLPGREALSWSRAWSCYDEFEMLGWTPGGTARCQYYVNALNGPGTSFSDLDMEGAAHCDVDGDGTIAIYRMNRAEKAVMTTPDNVY